MHEPVDDRCPRCGTETGGSRFCGECMLQLRPGDDFGSGQSGLLRRAWERDHPEAAEAFERWAATRDGPPPGVTNPVLKPVVEHPLDEWKPLDGRLLRLTIVFAALALLDAVAIVADVMELNLLQRIDRGENVPADTIDANDTRMGIIGILQTLLYVTAAVVFIQWFHRAYQNVTAIRGAERRHGTGWAIGGWFVPILSLFRPKQIANDLWAAGGKTPSDMKPSPLLALWWALFLISSFIGRYIFRRIDAEEIDELITLDKLYIASDALDVVGAVLAVVVATRITRRMTERRQESETAQAAPVASPAIAGSAGPPIPF